MTLQHDVYNYLWKCWHDRTMLTGKFETTCSSRWTPNQLSVNFGPELTLYLIHVAGSIYVQESFVLRASWHDGYTSHDLPNSKIEEVLKMNVVSHLIHPDPWVRNVAKMTKEYHA